MKAHIPIEAKIGSKDLKEIQAWARAYACEEYEKRNRDATRRLFQLITIALNDTHGFGKQRITELFGGVQRLMEEHDKDTEFWEHVQRRCEQIGVDFKP